ncbi:hypothetical protein GCM10010240_14110 [Streptomyces griseoviridis]|nr:hypothetical protein GCM10010240_14110 [Streptomyces griseoviridis]
MRLGGLLGEIADAALPRLVDVLDVAAEVLGDLPELHPFLGAQAYDLVLSHEAEIVVWLPPGHVTSLVRKVRKIGGPGSWGLQFAGTTTPRRRRSTGRSVVRVR